MQDPARWDGMSATPMDSEPGEPSGERQAGRTGDSDLRGLGGGWPG